MKNKILLIMFFGIMFLLVINLINAFDWNNGAVSYWGMNEGSGTLVQNSVIGAVNGTLMNATYTKRILGKNGNALEFNYSQSGVNISDALVNKTLNTDFTICFWFILPDGTADTWFLGQWGGNFIINPQANRSIRFITADSQSQYTTDASDGNWHFLCAIRERIGYKSLFYDNVLYGNVSYNYSTTWSGNTVFGSVSSSTYSLGTALNGSMDELGIWNRSLSTSEITELWNGGLGLFYTGYGITVTLNSPANNSQYLSGNGINLTTNYLSVSTETIPFELINTTYNVWFENGTVYNLTTQNLTGTNYTKSIIFNNLGFNNYIWNAYACMGNGVGSNCTWSGNNKTFEVLKYKINSVNYTSSTIEGGTEVYAINFSLSSLYQVSTVNLIYNGIQYAIPYYSQDNFILGIKSIIIPDLTASANISLFWNITLDDGTFFISNTYNQTVNILSIDDCSVNTHILYNLTLFDEKTQINLTSTTSTSIEVNFNLYSIDRSTPTFKFTKLYKDINPAKICSNLILTTNYSLDAVIKYFSEGNSTSSIEYYNILNSTIGSHNQYQNISLYALNVTEATDFQLTFKDKYLALDPNILFYIMREYVSEGIYKIVEVPKTDSNGQAVLHLVRNDVRYNLLAVDSAGNIVATFNNVVVFCQDYTIGSCTINLNARPTEDKVYNYNNDVDISYSIGYSNTTKLVALSFLSKDSTTKTVSINILRNSDFGNRTVCSNSLISIGGIITCNVSSVTNTDRFLFIEIYVDGELKSMETIDLEADTRGFGTSGYFIAWLMILFFITMFIDDKQGLIAIIAVGWITVLAFGLVKGSIFGMVSGGVWLVVTIIILIWKLKKEETG